MIHATPQAGSTGGSPPGRQVLELPGPVAASVEHPEWAARFPWLVQGTTGRGDPGAPFDLRLNGPGPVGDVLDRWEALRQGAGAHGVVAARQVHGNRVVLHPDLPEGFHLVAGEADGHATRAPGVLLAVTVADCVPAFLVDPRGRGVALLHAGWRGVVAGILEEGVAALHDRLGVEPGELLLHLGPSICGGCYEVGPEVHVGLGLEPPPGPAPVDLQGALARRAVALGMRDEAITRSGHCTLEGPGPFFSHRGGDSQRQVAFLGIRPQGPARP